MIGLRRFAERHWWTLAFVGIIVLSIVVRVAMLARANWMLDGDEATMALVGRHIQQRHERPIFFPGQAYMGAWQAYLSAIAFQLFGMSRPVAKMIPALSSSAFVATAMLLARRIYDPRTAILAGAFAAVPSIYLMSITLRVSYPLIDVMAIGNVILLIAVDSVWRSDPPGRFWVRFLALGLLAGFGFWLHAAVALFVLPAGIALTLRWPKTCFFPGVPLAALGFVLGASPVFQFARHHVYTTFDYLLGSDSDTAQRDVVAIARHLVRTILPRILGAATPWDSTPLVLQLAIAVPSVAAIAYLGWRVRRAPLTWARLRPQRSAPESIVALVGVTVIAAYLLSRFSVYAILYPTLDATGRYLAPLGAFLPIALAGAVRALAAHGPRMRAVGLSGAALILAATSIAWALAPPESVFQSPYFRQLPASNDALIDALDAMGIEAVWMDHWAGKPLMFDTHDRIAAADWVDLRVCGGIDRLGRESGRVFASDEPAFVLVSSDARTDLEALLDARGIPFQAAHVDGYVVVRPLEPVDPATVVDALWRAC